MPVEEITTRSEMERAYAGDRPAPDGTIVRAEPTPGRISLPRYDGLKTCVHCGGVCHREHVAVDDCRPQGFCITLTYCEHCDVGTEILWSATDTGWELDVRATHRSAKLALFLRRLEALQCVAA